MPFSKYHNWRVVLASVFGCIGLILLWLACTDVQLPARATSSRAFSSQIRLSPDLGTTDEEARLLQSAVDSVAVSLGSLLERISDPASRKSLLATALNTLTFELGGDVFFTAWQGTRVLHSPLSPDAANMDFAQAVDYRGTPFVVEMAQKARKGGGFMQVLLPPPLSPRGADEPLARPVSQGAGSSPSTATRPGVEQVLYVRPIPHSNWHIAAFMPADPDLPGQAAALVTDNGPLEKESSESLRKRMRAGMGLSGFSLTGMAGLLLAARRSTWRPGVFSSKSE